MVAILKFFKRFVTNRTWDLNEASVLIVFFVTFPCGILGQVWYLIVSIPDCCHLSYFGMVGNIRDKLVFRHRGNMAAILKFFKLMIWL